MWKNESGAPKFSCRMGFVSFLRSALSPPPLFFTDFHCFWPNFDQKKQGSEILKILAIGPQIDLFRKSETFWFRLSVIFLMKIMFFIFFCNFREKQWSNWPITVLKTKNAIWKYCYSAFILLRSIRNLSKIYVFSHWFLVAKTCLREKIFFSKNIRLMKY